MLRFSRGDAVNSPVAAVDTAASGADFFFLTDAGLFGVALATFFFSFAIALAPL